VVDGGSHDLLSGGTVIATLESVDLVIGAGVEPQFDLDLQVLGGSSETTIIADTGLVSFATIPAELSAGRLVGSGTVWDIAGNDGAWITGQNQPGYGVFQAYYNGAATGGSVFAEALGLVWASTGGTATASESVPGNGYDPIGVPVDDMDLHVAFNVSPGDRASVSSIYGLDVPEPGTFALFVVVGAGLMVGRRRG
jgi:hypothetical protein